MSWVSITSKAILPETLKKVHAMQVGLENKNVKVQTTGQKTRSPNTSLHHKKRLAVLGEEEYNVVLIAINHSFDILCVEFAMEGKYIALSCCAP